MNILIDKAIMKIEIRMIHVFLSIFKRKLLIYLQLRYIKRISRMKLRSIKKGILSWKMLFNKLMRTIY